MQREAAVGKEEASHAELLAEQAFSRLQTAERRADSAERKLQVIIKLIPSSSHVKPCGTGEEDLSCLQAQPIANHVISASCYKDPIILLQSNPVK